MSYTTEELRGDIVFIKDAMKIDGGSEFDKRLDAISEIIREKGKRDEGCEFVEDEEYWECSECGLMWSLNDGNPFDNEMRHCPKCGLIISAIRFTETDYTQDDMPKVERIIYPPKGATP
jgi:rubrerythrin